MKDYKYYRPIHRAKSLADAVWATIIYVTMFAIVTVVISAIFLGIAATSGSWGPWLDSLCK